MDKIKISLSHAINLQNPVIFIPILTSRLTGKTSLVDEVRNYIPIGVKYTSILSHIESNIKKNELSGASLTIELADSNCKVKIAKTQKKSAGGSLAKSHPKSHPKSQKKTTGTDTSTTSHGDDLYQIYLVVIKDTDKANDKAKAKAHTKTSHTAETTTHNNLLEKARQAGNSIFQSMKANQIPSINLIDTVCESSFISAVLEGLLLSSYKFLKYKTNTKPNEKYAPDHIHITSRECTTINNSQISIKNAILSNLKTEIESVFLARDLVNEPANNAKATVFIDAIRERIKDWKLPVDIEILDSAKLKALGFGLLLGVGAGSNDGNAPRVVILKYNGDGGGKHDTKSPDIVLLGKGITFDTGGLDLKSARSMSEMKSDLAGAATVMSFLLGYAKIKGPKSIYTICPFAENSIGPNSTKPSDILTAFNGKTVEVTDTDAEGRLVLADCLAYANKHYPKAMLVDFATLTGQQETVSCKMFSNVLGVNSEIEMSKMIKDGARINEPLVELPMMESKYIDKLDSVVADIKNVSGNCSADIILSAVFMHQFISDSAKWIHIDIAGPSFNNAANVKYMGGEGSGVGVRLLFEYFDCC
uniref:Cytosol aminopeptidase domain-containing protein n=1 Tax=viral metagenome TaxID=1070528 RepID=A0A6C0HMV3_9ZZZZ